MARNILNISLPTKMAQKVKKEARKGGYASVSEYVRHILRNYEERQELLLLQESQAEIRAGKGKKLGSLKELR